MMKGNKRFRVLLISLLTMLLAMSCTVFTAIATTEFKMIDGASIRVAQTVDGYYGIRFGAQIADTEKSYKMLIIPEDYYDGYLSATDKNDRNVVEYLIDKFGESNLSIVQNCAIKDGVAYGSILRVKYNNLNRGFLGVAYYETESEGNTVYNTAAFATERPNAYTIAEIAAENYDYYVEQGADEAVAGLKNIIYNAINQKNGISESDSANITPVINVVEESKKVFVGEAFTLSYENAVASSLVKYTGENVSVVNGNITVNVAGTTTITADLLGLTDTVSVTAVSKNIVNLKGTSKTITWDKVVGADKYIITVNGTEYETATNSYTLTTGGVYDISVCAVVGEAKGNAASLTKYSTATDDILLHNMTNVSFAELSHESGDITFTHEFDNGAYNNNNAATVILKKSYGAGQFIKLGFTATAASLYGNKQSISISRTTDDATSLNGKYSLQAFDFASIALSRGWNSPINYTTTISGQPSIYGEIWAGALNKLTSMEVGKKYYIAIGWEERADDTIIHIAFFDNTDTLLTAISWKLSDIAAADNRNTAPEAGYIGIHSWGTGEKTISYELLSKEELFANVSIAPTISRDGGKVSFEHPLAENYLVSINGGKYETISGNSITLEYGIYSISAKAIYGNTESIVASTTVKYLEDNIELYNISNVVSNGNAPTYEKGSLSFTFEYEDAYRHNSVARSSSAIVLNKPYTTGEFIKVGFTATTNSIKDAHIGIGILGTTSRPYDSFAPSRHTLDTTKDGAGFLLGYSENKATDYLGIPSASASETHSKGVNLNGGLTIGKKYFIAVGVESTQTDKVLTVAILDADGNVLNLYTLSQAAAQARNSAFGAFPDSGHFAILYFGAEYTSTTIDYEIIAKEDIYGKIALSGITDYTKTTNGDVTTVRIGANQIGATISTVTKYTNEFVKVGFTAVDKSFYNNGLRVGVRQSQIATVASNCFTGATFGTGLVWWPGQDKNVHNGGYGVGTLSYYDSAFTSTGMGPTGRDEKYGKLVAGNDYYIIAGAVTDETDTILHFVLTDADGKVLFVVYYSYSAIVGANAAYATVGIDGYLAVSSTLATERTLTYEILTEEEGMAIVNSIA